MLVSDAGNGNLKSVERLPSTGLEYANITDSAMAPDRLVRPAA
jgi:hypothetical protein